MFQQKLDGFPVSSLAMSQTIVFAWFKVIGSFLAVVFGLFLVALSSVLMLMLDLWSPLGKDGKKDSKKPEEKEDPETIGE